jgi:uncharacterized protein
MRPTGHIDYVELPCRDLELSKAFFTAAFGWGFVDYGPDYASFEDAGLDGGFYRADAAARVERGSALVVLFSHDLEATEAAVREAGGEILKPIFPFPGGRRFHFLEPSGNELAVWALPLEGEAVEEENGD